ncbi:MAG: alpha/beta hydrolase fold domain-containing protein [Erysipelotrichaceae bacterium]|jgi:monoterpene epsilon-lactone hydrolase
MSNLSFKYRFLKGLIKLMGVKNFFSKDKAEIVSKARKGMEKTKVPIFSHSEINYEIKDFCGEKVVYISHKKPTKKACLFIIGGGMLAHPLPGSVKTALKIAVQSGRNMLVPYYPLCIDYTIAEVYDWLYPLYKSMLETYKVEDILVTGSSSGASLALGLVSHINALGKKAELPKRIYASSPGQCFTDIETIRKGRILNEKDIILPVSYMEIAESILTHGENVPEYMLYLEKGDYHGLEEVYLSYGSNEVLYAAYEVIKNRLEEHGVRVISEIGENLFHCYPFFPVVREAKPGWENMLKYHKADDL